MAFHWPLKLGYLASSAACAEPPNGRAVGTRQKDSSPGAWRRHTGPSAGSFSLGFMISPRKGSGHE